MNPSFNQYLILLFFIFISNNSLIAEQQSPPNNELKTKIYQIVHNDNIDFKKANKILKNAKKGELDGLIPDTDTTLLNAFMLKLDQNYKNKDYLKFYKILSKKVNLNYQDKNGYSTLHMIVSNQLVNSLKILIRPKNININLQDNNDDSALHLALKNLNTKNFDKNSQMIRDLISHKADIHLKNNQNFTPLQLINQLSFETSHQDLNTQLTELKNLFIPKNQQIATQIKTQ